MKRLPYGKNHQRYLLYLTVFWFRLARISKKTVRNTVNLSAINGSNLLDSLPIALLFQLVIGAVRKI